MSKFLNSLKEVQWANEALARELGRNPHGENLYKWVHSSDLVLMRFTGNKMVKASTSGLLLPEPQYTKVRAYPHMGDRWLLAMWKYYSESEWLTQFGYKMAWPQRGDYYPTDLLLKPGKTPDVRTTEEIMQMVRHTRAISAKEAEARWESEDQARERALHGVIADIIDDALTAFGNDPGKRSGGVSFGGI